MAVSSLIGFILIVAGMFFGITYLFWVMNNKGKSNPKPKNTNKLNSRNTAPIHPVWCLLALPGMIALLGSDAGNNLSVVHRFATGELSLWSWQGLALGCAIAAAPLGFAASRKKGFWLPCLMVAGIGGILTVMSTNTDFSARSVGATTYQATTQGLIQERDTLLKSLNGTPPCSAQRWCDSQAKENRVAEINKELASTPAQVDPLATPNGALLAEIMAYLRAFGVPLVVAALGNVLGLMFWGRSSKVSAPSQSPASPADKGKCEEVPTNYPEKKSPHLSVESSVKRAKKWLDEQEPGRVSKQKLKVASKASQKTITSVVKELVKSGDLERMKNGQLSKPSKALALPDNVVPLEASK